jgi:hypothetical protein
MIPLDRWNSLRGIDPVTEREGDYVYRGSTKYLINCVFPRPGRPNRLDLISPEGRMFAVSSPDEYSLEPQTR